MEAARPSRRAFSGFLISSQLAKASDPARHSNFLVIETDSSIFDLMIYILNGADKLWYGPSGRPFGFASTSLLVPFE
jgi:hypothetical protein